MLPERVDNVVRRLVGLMDASDGFCYDTYDTRVGSLYLLLSRKRASPSTE